MGSRNTAFGREPYEVIVALTFAAVLLGACAATQVAVESSPTPVIPVPGFWLGVWHGFIAPVAFVVSLFSDHVRIYGVPNAGRWYDFGFMLGIGGFSGGLFAGSRRKTVVVHDRE